MGPNSFLTNQSIDYAANELHAIVKHAMDVVGPASWPSAVEEGMRDVLFFYSDGEGEPAWFLCAIEDDDGEVVCPMVVEDDDLVIEPSMAADLIAAFLRNWLWMRGWQVQGAIRSTGKCQWRLVDCLSFADGGGDRLDDDYPYGQHELDVLCQSVVTLVGH
ncbi:MAG: hypothetical protein ACPGXK_03450 [Phycisphaerae bacterium]